MPNETQTYSTTPAYLCPKCGHPATTTHTLAEYVRLKCICGHRYKASRKDTSLVSCVIQLALKKQ